MRNNQRFLVIQMDYARLLEGDWVSVIVLTQLLEWITDHDWTPKTYQEWRDELHLSAFQVARAVKKLAIAGIETKVMKNVDFVPVLHYRLNNALFQKWAKGE